MDNPYTEFEGKLTQQSYRHGIMICYLHSDKLPVPGLTSLDGSELVLTNGVDNAVECRLLVWGNALALLPGAVMTFYARHIILDGMLVGRLSASADSFSRLNKQATLWHVCQPTHSRRPSTYLTFFILVSSSPHSQDTETRFGNFRTWWCGPFRGKRTARIRKQY